MVVVAGGRHRIGITRERLEQNDHTRVTGVQPIKIESMVLVKVNQSQTFIAAIGEEAGVIRDRQAFVVAARRNWRLAFAV